MGVDWSDLVVTIDSGCGTKCIVPKLEDMLLHYRKKIVDKQRAILARAKLLSYGLQDHALQHADAVASLLVQSRHFAQSLSHAPPDSVMF